jgi:hypothetical protein
MYVRQYEISPKNNTVLCCVTRAVPVDLIVFHLLGGTNHYKVLMDNFRLLSTAFLELGQG